MTETPSPTAPHPSSAVGPAPAAAPAGADDADPRIAAFCSPERPEVFHAVAYRNDVWKEDPFDVETIHAEARATFERLVDRATAPSGPAAGRILLLLGEAGSGKTHLLRAFRNGAHGRGRGYFGYVPMTSATSHYGRYVLNNLIDSLDQPYHEPAGETSALMRLSHALAESSPAVPLDRLDRIRNDDLDPPCLARLIEALADQVVEDPRFNAVDIDLLRALLFLQAGDPRIKSRVLKYLRCEDLSEPDRRLLGGLVPRTYDDAPQWVVQRLGELMAALESVPSILGVDQLEDLYNLDDAAARFRRAMATLCDLAGRLSSAVVVISCLEDFYKELSRGLTRPLVDRIEKDPAPTLLKGVREEEEVVELVARRLRSLYESLEVPAREDDPLFPFPRSFLHQLAGLRTRDVLERCQEYRERCVAAGRLVPIEGQGAVVPDARGGGKVDTIHLEQAWNDFRATFAGEVPEEDEGLAGVLAGAIRACSEELEDGHWFEAEAEGRLGPVECHGPDNGVRRLLVGVCNVTARGGHLGRQVAEVAERAGEHTPVLVRSTEVPTSPTAAVARQIGDLIARGGRRAVVEDSEWRTMMALARFRSGREPDPVFAAWLGRTRPLTGLAAIRTILGLNGREAAEADR